MKTETAINVLKLVTNPFDKVRAITVLNELMSEPEEAGPAPSLNAQQKSMCANFGIDEAKFAEAHAERIAGKRLTFGAVESQPAVEPSEAFTRMVKFE